jgi:hypothetical protein
VSKYAALETFLRNQEKNLVPATFAEIEKIVGQPLPASAKYPAWWSNNPSNNAMTKIWRRAGFRTEQVNVVRKTLVFRRLPPRPPEPPMSNEQQQQQQENLMAPMRRINMSPADRLLPEASGPKKRGVAENGRAFSASRHPLRGALKGVLRLVGGTDLTKPADPEWGNN